MNWEMLNSQNSNDGIRGISVVSFFDFFGSFPFEMLLISDYIVFGFTPKLYISHSSITIDSW